MAASTATSTAPIRSVLWPSLINLAPSRVNCGRWQARRRFWQDAGMANYLATVQMHLGVPEDYERLHASMKQRGYLRQITGEDGVFYQLPAGTYLVTGSSANLEVALRAAVDAANETGKKCGVMVTDWNAVTWSGLEAL